MSFNKTQKMLKMVDMMTRRGGVRAHELMDRFDLDSRTLRRYLADLRDIDIPVRDDGRSDDRVITVDPSYRRTGVQLTLAEVLSLHFGRTLFNFLEGTSFAEDLTGAIERLEPAISRAHADLARHLDTKFLAVPEHTKDYRDASEIIDEVVTALVYNNPLEVRYRKPSGVEGRYHLRPFTLATYRQGLYLFALDVEAAQVKTFALERFTSILRMRNDRFDYPLGWHPKAHLAHAFGIIGGEPEDISIAFAEGVAGYIRERTWHPTQTISTLPDGRIQLRLRASASVELEIWILGFGPDAEVLSPPSLRNRIRDRLADALARYGE